MHCHGELIHLLIFSDLRTNPMFNKVIISDAKKVIRESSVLLWILLKECSFKYLAICVVCLLVLTVYPVLEILLFKFAIEILVLNVNGNEGGFSYQSLAMIVVGTMFLYSIKYVSRVGRVEVVNKLFRIAQSIFKLQHDSRKTLSGWARLVLLEVTFLSISLLQLVSLMGLATYISVEGGGIPVFVAVLSLISLVGLSGKEYMAQKKLRYNRKLNDRKGEHQIRSRIKASEWTSFFGNVFSLCGFVCLLMLGVWGYMDGMDVLVLSFLLRFSNTLFAGMCGSTMRLVRSYVYAEGDARSLIKWLS